MTKSSRRNFLRHVATIGVGLAGARLRGQSSKIDPGQDMILKAMLDEVERSRTIRVPGVPEAAEDLPYFISYTLDDADDFGVVASLGAVTGTSRNRFRSPFVQVRVGGYDFDNTGHVYSGYYNGSRYDQDPLPLDDLYDALRERFWLATDFAFKAAVESIARKRAALRNAAAQNDKFADFSKGEAIVSLEKVARSQVDEAAWTARITRLSDLFRPYREVLSSSAEFHINQGTTYLVNTEGTALRYRDDTAYISVRAEGQAADGMLVREGMVFPALALSQVPAAAEIEKAVTQMAQHVQSLVKAPVGEAFTGPVLFEPMAAAQLLAQLLGDNFRPVRKPVSDPGRPLNVPPSEFESRMGGRVLPEWFDVIDDPTQTTWQGQPLAGSYPFDFEGIRPKPVKLIEKGILKAFLSTRQPMRNAPVSNGHARLPGPFQASAACIGNLFVTAHESSSLADLKARIIQLCKDRELPYGILIRKLDFPFTGGTAELQSLQSMSRDSGGSVRPASPPVLAYRVYPDGREELVRGLRFKGLRSRSLRDILAASSESAAFHYMNNGAPLARPGGGGYLALTTVVAPGLLFDELELDRGQEQLERPPLVPPPPNV